MTEKETCASCTYLCLYYFGPEIPRKTRTRSRLDEAKGDLRREYCQPLRLGHRHTAKHLGCRRPALWVERARSHALPTLRWANPSIRVVHPFPHTKEATVGVQTTAQGGKVKARAPIGRIEGGWCRIVTMNSSAIYITQPCPCSEPEEKRLRPLHTNCRHVRIRGTEYRVLPDNIPMRNNT